MADAVTAAELRAFAARLRSTDPASAADVEDLLDATGDAQRALGWWQSRLATAAVAREVWKGTSATSEQDWWSQQTGQPAWLATAQLAAAEVAEAVPALGNAVRDGSLSSSQSMEIASVAQTATSDELQNLIAVAGQDSFEQLKVETGRIRAHTATEEHERRAWERRSLTVGSNDRHEMVLRGHGPLADAVRLHTLLAAKAEELWRLDRKSGRKRSARNRLFDAHLLLLGLPEGPEPPAPAPPDPSNVPPPAPLNPRSPGGGPRARSVGGPASGKGGPSSDSGGSGTGIGGPPSDPPECGGAAAESPPDGNGQARLHLGPSVDTNPRPGSADGAELDLRAPPTLRGVLRIDHGALRRGHTLPGEICDLNGLQPLTVKALLAQARGAKLTAIVTDADAGGSVVGVAPFGSNYTRRELDLTWLTEGSRAPGPLVGARTGLKLLVHVTADALLLPWPEGSFLAEVARRASVDLLRSTGRGCNAAQVDLLDWAQPLCQVAGCTHSARVENDHRIDWVRCRITDFRFIDRLCPFHHRQKTHHGYRLAAGSGRRLFLQTGGSDQGPSP